MALPGVDLDHPLIVPVDQGSITGQNTYDALNFAYPGPAMATTWREILSAALRVGRANWLTQIRVSWPARYEAGRRVMHLLSHLNETHFGIGDRGLVRSNIFEDEDGSEKVFSSYAIGMALCQTFATNVLQLPALAHFDMIHGAGGTRPDLVHPTATDQVFIEAKGRYRRLQPSAMTSAVEQLFAHNFVPTMSFAAATATCFDNGSARLSMHCRVWNPGDAPYAWRTALNDEDQPVEALTVVASHLLGAADANADEPNGLFVGEADNRPVVCAREPRTGLLLGLTEEQAVRGWDFVGAYSNRPVDTRRLLDRARSADIDTADKRSSDLKVTNGLVLGWPDSVKYANGV